MANPIVLLAQSAENAEAAAVTAEGAENTGLMGSTGMDMMDLLIAGTCAYVLYSGITGKGSIFKDETIHPSRREDYRKVIRLFCLIGGPIGILSVVIQRFVNPVAGYILTGLFLAMIVALCVVIWPMNIERTNKKSKEGKGATRTGGSGKS